LIAKEVLKTSHCRASNDIFISTRFKCIRLLPFFTELSRTIKAQLIIIIIIIIIMIIMVLIPIVDHSGRAI
jgi:hypothetical protein